MCPLTSELDTAPDFVDELFRVIEYKSYLPGAPPPPKKRSETAGESRYTEHSSHTNRSDTSPQTGSRKHSRKRSYYDRGDVDASSGHAERAYKQPRRGQWDPSFLTRGDGGTDEYQNQPYPNGYSQLPAGPAPYDPHYPQPPTGPQAWRDASPRMPAYSQVPPYGTPQGPRRNRQKCRDFATKGYCARGSSCQYDHGSEPIWLPANDATNGPPQLSGKFHTTLFFLSFPTRSVMTTPSEHLCDDFTNFIIRLTTESYIVVLLFSLILPCRI